jgi:hypothetical protein
LEILGHSRQFQKKPGGYKIPNIFLGSCRIMWDTPGYFRNLLYALGTSSNYGNYLEASILQRFPGESTKLQDSIGDYRNLQRALRRCESFLGSEKLQEIL